MPPYQVYKRDDFLPNIVGDDIENALAAYPDATHLALFENVDMWSSSLGQGTTVVVGPSNTFKTPNDCVGKWLNDLPSQRQYFTKFISVGDFNG